MSRYTNLAVLMLVCVSIWTSRLVCAQKPTDAFARSDSEWVPFLAPGTARCALAAEYGVDSYPTQVVIDREGRVVTGYSWGKALEKTLGVETPSRK